MDRDWAERLRRDDPAALEEVMDAYGAYAAKIIAAFLGRTLPPEDMEEVLSDVFVNLWNSRKRLRGEVKPYLAAIALPDSLRAIGDEAFKGCARLTDVDLSMVVDGQRLGVQCFMNCTSLVTVTLSGSLSALPDGMFSGCTALSEVRGNDSLPRSGSAFYGCDRLAGREESGT